MTGNSSPAGGRAGAADGVAAAAAAAAAARFSLLPLLPLAIAAKEERCDMEKPKKEKPLGGSSSNGWMGSFWEWCGKINGKINVDGRMAALHFCCFVLYGHAELVTDPEEGAGNGLTSFC